MSTSAPRPRFAAYTPNTFASSLVYPILRSFVIGCLVLSFLSSPSRVLSSVWVSVVFWNWCLWTRRAAQLPRRQLLLRPSS
ncbi:hypothetical protein GQ53DRAFT_330754 [Thozetella sp. PMI_491]|nr:hypothetical protein GQ53DRAFT_330754 [Thozetella sp. PMI_491]